MTAPARAIVVDIEGTVAATRAVLDTLFPYARARLRSYVESHAGEPRVEQLVDDVRRELGQPDADVSRVVVALEAWSDSDAKVTPLKTLQGWIWADGFGAGDLSGSLFPDVAPALREWHDAGHTLAVFSSGSVVAQQNWFGHTPDGDLRPLFAAWFDTANAGPKRERSSYDAIARALDADPPTIVFLSDVAAELDAARAAGWQTVGVRRSGEPAWEAGVGDHAEVASFADVEI